MNRILKNIIIIITLAVFAMVIVACEREEDGEIFEQETIYIPEPANKYAVDKETEVETIEPTEAHRPYPEDYSIKPSKEITIGEKEFLTRINYIYKHIDLFENSDIIIEGMYGLYTSWDETFTSPMVYRNGPGEYGDDQYSGFYLANIENMDLYIDDWLKVKGKPYIYEHTDSEGEVQKFLFLNVETCEVLTTKERKAEMVNN